MKKTLLILIWLFSFNTSFSQSPDCIGAEPFCTGTNYTFPASTNTTGNFPPNAYFDCLGSQPNPVFYYLQIDQPGNITINMQSAPLVDIDFICWGPFTDPNTMCDSLTAPYVVDCSYSTAAIEQCDITNAITGQYYILLITNYSNVNCNIDFSQNSSSTGTTDCCILGDAGEDNLNPGYTACSSAPSFNMENELNGAPTPGGTWYDDTWNTVNNTFDPANGTSGTYSYIVLGTPPPGSTITCPDDTAFLAITINPNPIINFPILNDICTNAPQLTLDNATPTGGVYSGNGVNAGIFTPSSSNIGDNTITYNYTDANGCSDIETQIITVNEAPNISLGLNTEIPCESTINITPIINGGLPPYTYLWSDGSSNSNIIASGGTINLTLSDANNCTGFNEIVITQGLTPTATISGGGELCDNGKTDTINFTFSAPPWNLSYTNGNIDYTINGISDSTYTLYTSIPGLYSILIADDENECAANIIGDNIIPITVNPLPNPVIEPGFYEIYPNEEITLTAGTYAYYEWYSYNSDSLISENEYITIDSTLTLYIIVKTEKGCEGRSANAIINYIPRVELYIPNAFTPNGDDHNELFVINGSQIETFEMLITNRWGEVVYTTNDINKSWDGKYKKSPAAQGPYSYKIDIIGKDKRNFTATGVVNVLY